MPPNMSSIIKENKYLKWDFCKEKPTCNTKHACLPVQINSASAPAADLSRHETHWTANTCQATQMQISPCTERASNAKGTLGLNS